MKEKVSVDASMELATTKCAHPTVMDTHCVSEMKGGAGESSLTQKCDACLLKIQVHENSCL